MGIRTVLIAASLALASAVPASAQVVAWEDAFHLTPARPTRPKPIEPDARDDGPFHAEPMPPPSNDPGPTRPGPLPGPPPQPPALWEVVDAWGQRWRHADAAYLQSWVASRNASPPGLQFGAGSTCGPGGCPPARTRFFRR